MISLAVLSFGDCLCRNVSSSCSYRAARPPSRVAECRFNSSRNLLHQYDGSTLKLPRRCTYLLASSCAVTALEGFKMHAEMIPCPYNRSQTCFRRVSLSMCLFFKFIFFTVKHPFTFVTYDLFCCHKTRSLQEFPPVAMELACFYSASYTVHG